MFNFQECRIPINNRNNINYLRNWLFDYKDKIICDLLEFGFPLGYQGDDTLLKQFDKKKIWKLNNHKGARDYPEAMNNYLQKEKSNNAIIGPFKDNPFESGIKISPLNSLPKKDTAERRVIDDLSFPERNSVDDYIPNLLYPKVDDFIQVIKQTGRGCLLLEKDLRRAFRQIPICPSNYNLVAFTLKNTFFGDTVLSMGCRSSAYLCQRVTNAVAFIMFKIGILVLNYLDDLASAETKENALFAYNTLSKLLQNCGIEEAKDKSCPPCTVMTFIGVLFNTESMAIEITPERLLEVKKLIKL